MSLLLSFNLATITIAWCVHLNLRSLSTFHKVLHLYLHSYFSHLLNRHTVARTTIHGIVEINNSFRFFTPYWFYPALIHCTLEVIIVVMHCLDALFATPAIQCCNTIIGEFFLLQSLLLRASFGSQKYTCILVYVLKTPSAYERCCHGQSSPLEKWVLSVALSFQRLEHHCAGQCANMKYHAQPIYFTLF